MSNSIKTRDEFLSAYLRSIKTPLEREYTYAGRLVLVDPDNAGLFEHFVFNAGRPHYLGEHIVSSSDDIVIDVGDEIVYNGEVIGYTYEEVDVKRVMHSLVDAFELKPRKRIRYWFKIQ